MPFIPRLIALAALSTLAACGGGNSTAPDTLDTTTPDTSASAPAPASSSSSPATSQTSSTPSTHTTDTLSAALAHPHNPNTLILSYTPFLNSHSLIEAALQKLVANSTLSSFSLSTNINSATLHTTQPLPSLSLAATRDLFNSIQAATSPDVSLSLDYTSLQPSQSSEELTTPSSASSSPSSLSPQAAPAYTPSRSTSSWGLDRIDQAALPLNSRFINLHPGSGVTIYALGSGIKQTHPDLFGRVRNIAPNFASDSPTLDSCYTTGTHAASLISGSTYGVAPLSSIIPVRTESCSGATASSNIAAALSWVLSHAAANPSTPSLVYIPYALPASDTLDQIIKNLLSAGVHVIAPAGDNASDACNYSPARVPGVITVAATQPTDFSLASSNLGSCVKLFAPGEDILGAQATNPLSPIKRSGSHLSAAFTAGSVASLLQNQPKAKTADMLDLLISMSQAGQVKYAPTLPSSQSELALLSPDAFLQIGTVLTGKTNILSRSIHISKASSSSSLLPFSKWTSSLSFTVLDKALSPVQGASIQGHFQSNPSSSVSCLTDKTGSCSVSSRPVNDSSPLDSFVLKTISAPSKLYSPDSNSIPSTTITLSNPGRKKIFVKSISSSDNPSQPSSTSWYKTITTTILASDNSPAPNVNVSFALPSSPNTAYSSCTTNSQGQCSFQIIMTPATNSQTFNILKVQSPTTLYTPELNSQSSITVSGPTPAIAFISNLYATSSPRSASSWNASVTVQAQRSDSIPPANITIAFKIYGNRSVGCTTNSQGQCSINYVLPSNITQNSAYITSLKGPYLSYVPKQNRIDQVVVYRPASE